MRTFINYCISLGYISPFKVKLLKTDEVIKNIYTDYELELLLKKPDIKKCSFCEYRNWVLINHFLSTGNRLDTVCNIRNEDVDTANSSIVLKRVKNRKQQVIPMSNTLLTVITEYMRHRGGEPADYLYCSQYGQKLNKSGLEHAIAKYNRRRGVQKTSVHLFRNTFAKKWILNGGDIFRLQRLLGHSSLDMVKRYVVMFSDDLKKDFNVYNPLEEFNQSRKAIKIK